MQSNRRIQAVIFDMDGVLIDSEPLQYRACQEMLDRVGLILSEEAFRTRWVGHKTIDSLREMLRERGVEADPEMLMTVKRDAYHRLIATEPIVARDGIQWLVDWLHEHHIPLAVASSSTHADIRLVLTRLGLIERFVHLTSSEDCHRPKPDPEIYLLAARKLGVSPPHCLAIEDSRVGVRAAKAAGMVCVAFPHRFTADQDFSEADVLTGDLHALPGQFKWT